MKTVKTYRVLLCGEVMADVVDYGLGMEDLLWSAPAEITLVDLPSIPVFTRDPDMPIGETTTRPPSLTPSVRFLSGKCVDSERKRLDKVQQLWYNGIIR